MIVLDQGACVEEGAGHTTRKLSTREERLGSPTYRASRRGIPWRALPYRTSFGLSLAVFAVLALFFFALLRPEDKTGEKFSHFRASSPREPARILPGVSACGDGSARRNGTVASGETISLDDVTLYSPRLQLIGRPDRIVREGENLVPEEWKSSKRVSDGHRLQLGTYFPLIEDGYGARPLYGFVVPGVGKARVLEFWRVFWGGANQPPRRTLAVSSEKPWGIIRPQTADERISEGLASRWRTVHPPDMETSHDDGDLDPFSPKRWTRRSPR